MVLRAGGLSDRLSEHTNPRFESITDQISCHTRATTGTSTGMTKRRHDNGGLAPFRCAP